MFLHVVFAGIIDSWAVRASTSTADMPFGAYAQEVGSTYHSNRRNREGVGNSLRSCRSGRMSSAQRRETRRRCGTMSRQFTARRNTALGLSEWKGTFSALQGASSIQIRANQT
jgi:hypothetical protein